MKKRYRRAVYYSIGAIWCIVTSPIMILSIIGLYCSMLVDWLNMKFPVDWLQTKLRVYDYDTD